MRLSILLQLILFQPLYSPPTSLSPFSIIIFIGNSFDTRHVPAKLTLIKPNTANICINLTLTSVGKQRNPTVVRTTGAKTSIQPIIFLNLTLLTSRITYFLCPAVRRTSHSAYPSAIFFTDKCAFGISSSVANR